MSSRSQGRGDCSKRRRVGTEKYKETMADMMRMSGSGALGGFQRDKLGSPSTGSEDGGGIDLGDMAQELDQDEFDGPVAFNGRTSVGLYVMNCIKATFRSFTCR